MTPDAVLVILSSLLVLATMFVARRQGGLVSASGHAVVLVWLASNEQTDLLLPAIGVAILAGLIHLYRKVREAMQPDETT